MAWTQGSLMVSSDGKKISCCICFDWCNIDDLAKDEDGNLIDVCQKCHEKEEIVKKDKWCQSTRTHPEHGICLGWPRNEL